MVAETFEVLAFFRGVSARVAVDTPSILSPRKKRAPRNTSPEMHALADAWFERRFGVKYRSQALFVTSSSFAARGYAETERHVVRVIPLGPYRYCWSPQVRDMLSMSLDKAGNVESTLDAAGYIESNLHLAHELGHEVMLYCDKYIAVPTYMLDESEATEREGHQPSSGIIICI